MSRVGILGKNMAITLGEDMAHLVRTEYICIVMTLYKHLGRILNAQIGYLAPVEDIEYNMGTLNTKAGSFTHGADIVN